MRAQYELFPTKNGRWAFRLRAKNGRIVGPSQTYASKRNARQGADAHSIAAWQACSASGTTVGWFHPIIVEVAK